VILTAWAPTACAAKDLVAAGGGDRAGRSDQRGVGHAGCRANAGICAAVLPLNQIARTGSGVFGDRA
jgi:hypothetical protein